MPRLTKPGRHITIAAVLAATSLVTLPEHARAQDVEHRPWSELVVVVGHNVALSLPDGYVEGRALAVTHEALVLDVEKTSDAAMYPKGHTNVPRTRVSVIRLRRSDDRAPRVASQVIGQAAIMGGLFGLGSRSGIRGSLRGAGVQIGAATAGAVIGRRLDNRDIETVIRIVPEPGDDPGGSPDRRLTCQPEPVASKQSMYSSRASGSFDRRDWSRADVDEHDSGNRRPAGQPVPRCSDR
jgi:hypothetical protein